MQSVIDCSVCRKTHIKRLVKKLCVCVCVCVCVCEREREREKQRQRGREGGREIVWHKN
jgi:hypothetical protein